MADEKLAELIRLRLTQEDVFVLFETTVNPIIEETGKLVTSAILSAAQRGQNMYEELYGNLFSAPISNGEVRKLVMKKIVDQYNTSPDRCYDVVLVERQEGS